MGYLDLGGQALEKRMFDPHPRLPKWEEGYEGLGQGGARDNLPGGGLAPKPRWALWAADDGKPWWQSGKPLWYDQDLYGLGAIDDEPVVTVSPHPRIYAAVLEARRRRRGGGLGDFMPLSGLGARDKVFTNPIMLALLTAGAITFLPRLLAGK